MDLAMAIAIFTVGAVVGALLAHAWTADKHPMDLHSGPDDIERRARRMQ
jgi:hypothetical protein